MKQITTAAIKQMKQNGEPVTMGSGGNDGIIYGGK